MTQRHTTLHTHHSHHEPDEPLVLSWCSVMSQRHTMAVTDSTTRHQTMSGWDSMSCSTTRSTEGDRLAVEVKPTNSSSLTTYRKIVG
ncbi:hypothetical protein E2C01_073148 [Portunus trituberculatus]|uniref:Uncharacterized protein n=1 Tax=Portunus trituberculatus TaxID=210409 RepID=A0A5B7ID87_PORTR|nr:hypothetical protein [Portunus trituberculatus]